MKTNLESAIIGVRNRSQSDRIGSYTRSQMGSSTKTEVATVRIDDIQIDPTTSHMHFKMSDGRSVEIRTDELVSLGFTNLKNRLLGIQ